MPAFEVASKLLNTVDTMRTIVLALLLGAALCTEAAYKPSQTTHISEEVRDAVP